MQTLLHQCSDTSKEAEAIQIAILRKKSISERFDLAVALTNMTISLTKEGMRQRNPELNNHEINYLFIKHHHGEDLAESFKKYVKDLVHDK